MDGSPSRGETIPIRLFLGGFDLTPTFREVNKKYSTRYYLSLVLIDEGMFSLQYPSARQLSVDTNPTQMFNGELSRYFSHHIPFYPTLKIPLKVFVLWRDYPQVHLANLTCNPTDARRYFKQSEIVLYRQAPEGAQHLQIDMPAIGGKPPIQSPPIPA